MRSVTTRAVKANAMYMRATANAQVTGLSSIAVETAKMMVTTKSKVIKERRHKGLYSQTQKDPCARDTSTQMKESLKDFIRERTMSQL